jgi:mRNA interferase RelE/StbE
VVWKIEYDKLAAKQLKKLDVNIARKIIDSMDKLIKLKDFRAKGKMLVGDKKGFWRFRIDDYRVLCQIIDKKLIVRVLRLEHRKDVYK